MAFGDGCVGGGVWGGVGGVGLSPALAQNPPAPANSEAAQPAMHHHARMLPSQLVDGRVAFLKAELKITPAQEGQWQQVATAMHQNATALDQVISNARQQSGSMDAVQRLVLREQVAKVRADNDARLLTAFKPLYASLSPEQQQMANTLVGAHHGWHHRA